MKKIIFIIIAIVIIAAGVILMINMSKAKENINTLQYIVNKGELVLGLDDSFPPMGFRDENNNIVGFDIDVAKEVCKRMGISLKLQPISWEANEQELNSGNIDCIWNGMSVNSEREANMTLSEPYMENTMILVVLKNSGYSSADNLKGKNIGVQSGSTAQQILEESDFYNQIGKVISYSDNITAFMDLETGQINAVFLDSVLANYYITSKGKNYAVLSDGIAYKEDYAIGFRKGDTELRDKIQEILGDMKKDGALAEISQKWFGKEVTI